MRSRPSWRLRVTEHAPHAVVKHVVVFGRVLREGGLEVGPGRVSDALRGLDRVDLARQDDVYWTLRQTLVSRRRGPRPVRPRVRRMVPPPARRPPPPRARPAAAPRRTPEGRRSRPGPEIDGGELEVGAWSDDEVLRTRDFASMSPEEFARARSLIRAIALDRPRRRTHRLRADRRGSTLDVRALVRASLATGGDPVVRTFRSRGTAPRKLVLLLDVSGSMESYSRALLLYLHAARGSGRGVETFAFGTRLTRLTRGARDARPGRRARCGRDACPRLGGRHAHRRVAQGLQRRLGQACADARRRRRAALRRLRARRPCARARRDAPAGAAGVRGRAG